MRIKLGDNSTGDKPVTISDIKSPGAINGVYADTPRGDYRSAVIKINDVFIFAFFEKGNLDVIAINHDFDPECPLFFREDIRNISITF